MIRRPPISTRTDTRFPYTTLFRSVGIGVPGMVDAAAGEVSYAVNLRIDDAGVPVGRSVAARLGVPVTVENDLNAAALGAARGSEEHTSELQSLMRISYAVFCLKKKKHNTTQHTDALLEDNRK